METVDRLRKRAGVYELYTLENNGTNLEHDELLSDRLGWPIVVERFGLWLAASWLRAHRAQHLGEQHHLCLLFP